MNAQNIVEALGWTLVHFVWQGALAVLLLAILLRLLRTASARYLAATSMMALLLAIATVTFVSKLDWQRGGELSVGAPVVLADQAPAIAEGPSLVREPASAVGAIGNAKTESTDEIVATEAPAGAAGESPPASWLGWVVAGWLVGVALFAARFFLDWRAVVSLRKTAQLLDGESDWSERFSGLVKRIGISRPVQLLSSAAVHVPLVLGVLRPVVIVPLAMLSSLPPAQVDALLLHELAHVRRHDFLVNLLQSLVETVFFFHPAVWWISRKIREERENCCDDLAVSACGDDVRQYAGALAALEQFREPGSPSLSLAADGGHSAGGSLVSRIRRLVRRDGRSAPTSLVWPLASIAALVLAFACAFGVLVSITEGRADDDAFEDELVVRGKIFDEEPGKPNRDLPPAPLKGALVEAFTIGHPTHPVASTVSDANGEWELRFRIRADFFEKVSRRLEIRTDVPGYTERDLMAAGEMIMALAGEKVEAAGDEAEILRTGEIGEVTFRMLKAGTIRGVLHDGEGNPIPDAFVWVKVDDNEEPWNDDWVARPGVTGDSTTSGADGGFVLSRVPPNRELHIAASLRGGPSVQTDAYMLGSEEMTLNVKWEGDTLECAPDDMDHKPKSGDVPVPEKKEAEPEIVLTLNADGELSLDGKSVSDDDLLAVLKELADINPDQAVVIRAARETEFGKVAELLDLVKKAGLWNVAFATAQGKSAKKDKPATVDGGHQNEWSAEGKITDTKGRPMEGVEVIVFSGMGSLRRTGFAKSNADGSYRVTFSRGGLMSVDSHNLQVAQIGAHFPGYVENNLNRHGNGAMAMGSEGADSAIVQADFDNDGNLDLLLGNFEISAKDLKSFGVDADSLALPGRPRKLDFVMVPAVRVEGRLVGSGTFSGALPKVARKLDPNLPRGPYSDLDDSPLAGWKVWITGDELPPGSSVWDSAVVDEDGRFVFENVPAGFEWYFRTETNIPDHREPVSRKFTLARGEEVRTASVVLELKADQKKVDLDFPKPENDDQARAENDRPVDHNVTIEGSVVDAETGDIISQGVIVQGGLPQGDEVVWGFSEQRTSPGEQNGKFSTVMNIGRGDRARVVVDGYLPKAIFDTLPKFAPDVKVRQRSVALRRGRKVSGRVLNHKGEPVIGASVFAVGPAKLNLYDGKSWRASGNEDDVEEPVFRPVKTDGQGWFFGLHLSGTNRIAVSSKHLGAWPAMIAENRDQIEIRLPEPAAIGIDCCIPGGTWETQVYYQFLTPYMSDKDLWRNVSSDRTITITMGHTDMLGVQPGHYQIMRRKLAPMTNVAYSIAMDREYVKLDPGTVHKIDWSRKDSGARIKTTVRWPEDEELAGLMYKLTSKTPNKDFGDLDVPHVLDGGAIALETGELYSAAIPAGDYWLSIEAQRPIPEERLRNSSPIMPDYSKQIEVTVPDLKGKEFRIDEVVVFDE